MPVVYFPQVIAPHPGVSMVSATSQNNSLSTPCGLDEPRKLAFLTAFSTFDLPGIAPSPPTWNGAPPFLNTFHVLRSETCIC